MKIIYQKNWTHIKVKYQFQNINKNKIKKIKIL